MNWVSRRVYSTSLNLYCFHVSFLFFFSLIVNHLNYLFKLFSLLYELNGCSMASVFPFLYLRHSALNWEKKGKLTRFQTFFKLISESYICLKNVKVSCLGLDYFWTKKTGHRSFILLYVKMEKPLRMINWENSIIA